MRFAKTLLLAALLASCISCSTVQPPRAGDGQSFAVGLATEPSSQILVTFEDERNSRVPLSDAISGYRLRGNYGNSTWGLRVAEALVEDYGLRPVIQWPIDSLGIHCVVYEVPPQQSVAQMLQRLAHDKRVETVQPMGKFRVMAESYSDPYFKLQTGIKAMHIEPVHRYATGRNVKIAVIDTGVDGKHPDLDGQVLSEQNFVENAPDPLDDIHGTAVAGVIAASANNQQGIVGIAPGSKLIALKACWQIGKQKPEAECNSLTLALALNTAIHMKPDIINLSLNGPQDPLLERLLKKALDEGVIVVASSPSGNTPGQDFPASVQRVIAVRTAAAEGGQAASGYQSIPAPGQEILTTLPHATYNFMSGSSFAAAHVSGLVALLLELKPKLNPEQIRSILQASAFSDKVAGEKSAGMVDACAMLANLAGARGCEAEVGGANFVRFATPSSY